MLAHLIVLGEGGALSGRVITVEPALCLPGQMKQEVVGLLVITVKGDGVDWYTGRAPATNLLQDAPDWLRGVRKKTLCSTG